MTKQIVPKSTKKVKPKLTPERLKELLYYDPDTGLFAWNKKRRGIKINSKVGTPGKGNNSGYIQICVDTKIYQAHRLAFLYMEGYFPENDIDHINRIKDDNRWKNLRHVSKSCNMRNVKVKNNNKSGITGVSWHSPYNKWRSQIKINGKSIYLGSFTTLKEAAQARWEAEVKYGFPNCSTTSSAYQFLQNNADDS